MVARYKNRILVTVLLLVATALLPNACGKKDPNPEVVPQPKEVKGNCPEPEGSQVLDL
jgi:hypothetical protein